MQAAANAAAQDAASASSAVVKAAVGDAGDAQSRYYQLAHRYGFFVFLSFMTNLPQFVAIVEPQCMGRD